MTDHTVDIFPDRVVVDGERALCLEDVPEWARKYCKHLF